MQERAKGKTTEKMDRRGLKGSEIVGIAR